MRLSPLWRSVKCGINVANNGCVPTLYSSDASQQKLVLMGRICIGAFVIIGCVVSPYWQITVRFLNLFKNFQICFDWDYGIHLWFSESIRRRLGRALV